MYKYVFEPYFQSFGVYTQHGMTGSCGKCIFHFWGTTILHPELLSHFAFLLTVQKVQQQHLSTNKTAQRSIWLVQECHSVCRTKVVFIVSWLFDCLLFIKMLNIRSGSPPHNNWWSLGQPSLAEQCSEETVHAPKQQGTVLSFLIQNECWSLSLQAVGRPL